MNAEACSLPRGDLETVQTEPALKPRGMLRQTQAQNSDQFNGILRDIRRGYRGFTVPPGAAPR
jgi:hypothetical protein